MTTIGPEEQVDESQVMNVTDKVTGETSRYRRRRLGLWSFKNHAFSNDFVQGAVRKITLVRAGLGLKQYELLVSEEASNLEVSLGDFVYTGVE